VVCQCSQNCNAECFGFWWWQLLLQGTNVV
jgi:hypothetical protein